ncbi:Lipase, putative [Hondaea fermentalgiana]|uniref:Lipase, putative n=1 Tax=Hondaea fermentalgiana TaxID=2315210 RepID=A0A2R5G2R5_9STRA|nr:Lipase, putative [Hondaea fermentalgiana]|eukprot:GBG25316.1 Lipase, putative [Hondaea fermentalgiana]
MSSSVGTLEDASVGEEVETVLDAPARAPPSVLAKEGGVSQDSDDDFGPGTGAREDVADDETSRERQPSRRAAVYRPLDFGYTYAKVAAHDETPEDGLLQDGATASAEEQGTSREAGDHRVALGKDEIDAYDGLRFYVGDKNKAFREKSKKERSRNQERRKEVQTKEDKVVEADLEKGLTTTAVQNRRRPTVFKIVFDGDIYVSTIDILRDQISMCLVMGSRHDTVCVVVSSGGGAVTMYGLAAAQLARVRKRGMRLVVCVDSIAASGGYMMAAMADEIHASPFALVGSIGVISIVPNVQKLLEKHDIATYVFTAGKYKRTVDVVGEVTEAAKLKMLEELEEIHQVFKDHIVANRPALCDTIDEVATGEAWLAIEGKKKGLVDILQTSDEFLLALAPSHDLIEIKDRPIKKFPDNLVESAAKVSAHLWDRFTSRAAAPEAPQAVTTSPSALALAASAARLDMLWAWYVATQWRTGLALSGAGVAGAYVVARRELEWRPLGAAPFGLGVGAATLAAFGALRARIRPHVLRAGSTVYHSRPSFVRARNVTGIFVSREWREAIAAVSTLHDHVELVRFQRSGELDMHPHLGALGLLAAGDTLLKASHSPQHVTEEDQPSVDHLPSADDVELHLRAANAAYGAAFLGAMGLVEPSKAAKLVVTPHTMSRADRIAFCKYVNRNEEEIDFLHISSHSERLYGPKAYLIADHRAKRIILCLRGTSSISDVFTDLACDLAYVSVPDVDGPEKHIPTHDGILRSAHNVLDEVGEEMKQAAERFPDYKLSVCGHSLGAGTALLVTLELTLRKTLPRHLTCYAFGAPPMLAVPPTEQSKLFDASGLLSRATILNFVNGPDIIPRLSLWSANRLVHRLERIEKAVKRGDISRWTKWRTMRRGTAALGDGERAALLEAVDLDEHYQVDPDCEKAWEGQCVRMFHLGSMYYLDADRKLIPAAEERPIDADIVVDGHAAFLHAHMPSQYHAVYLGDKDLVKTWFT